MGISPESVGTLDPWSSDEVAQGFRITRLEDVPDWSPQQGKVEPGELYRQTICKADNIMRAGKQKVSSYSPFMAFSSVENTEVPLNHAALSKALENAFIRNLTDNGDGLQYVVYLTNSSDRRAALGLPGEVLSVHQKAILSITETFTCLQRKIMNLQSINVLWYGHSIVWLIVSPRHSHKLEARIAHEIQQLPTCNQFGCHDEWIIPISKLIDWGIDYKIFTQSPGEVVKTDYGVYSMKWTTGPSLEESLTSCEKDWLHPPLSQTSCHQCLLRSLPENNPEFRECNVIDSWASTEVSLASAGCCEGLYGESIAFERSMSVDGEEPPSPNVMPDQIALLLAGAFDGLFDEDDLEQVFGDAGTTVHSSLQDCRSDSEGSLVRDSRDSLATTVGEPINTPPTDQLLAPPIMNGLGGSGHGYLTDIGAQGHQNVSDAHQSPINHFGSGLDDKQIGSEAGVTSITHDIGLAGNLFTSPERSLSLMGSISPPGADFESVQGTDDDPIVSETSGVPLSEASQELGELVSLGLRRSEEISWLSGNEPDAEKVLTTFGSSRGLDRYAVIETMLALTYEKENIFVTDLQTFQLAVEKYSAGEPSEWNLDAIILIPVQKHEHWFLISVNLQLRSIFIHDDKESADNLTFLSFSDKDPGRWSLTYKSVSLKPAIRAQLLSIHRRKATIEETLKSLCYSKSNLF